MPDTLPLAARPARPARRAPYRAARIARASVRALRAPWGRKWLWLGSLGLVSLMRLGLWTLPLRTLQVLAARLGRGKFSAPISMQGVTPVAGDQVVVAEAGVAPVEREMNWAVLKAARMVPGASCLTQALSLQVLLARRGLGSRLCIGVRKGESKAFEAHAWVERGGRVLIGGEGNSGARGSWTPLTAWDFAADSAQGAADL